MVGVCDPLTSPRNKGLSFERIETDDGTLGTAGLELSGPRAVTLEDVLVAPLPTRCIG